jgi:RNA-binding protein
VDIVDIANMTFRTFAQATEDLEKVVMALKNASGSDEVTKNASTGYHGNPIVVLEAKIVDSKRIKKVFRSLGNGSIKLLLQTLDDRMDDESMFFFRLDKQESFRGNMVLANREDVIAVRAKVKSYPQSRANAMVVMSRFLEAELVRMERGGQKD